MATTTTRLALRKPATTDIVNVQTDINDNMDKVDDPLYIAALAADKVVRGKVTGDANERFHIKADGKIGWGPGNTAEDVTLYRNALGVLRTSGGLIVDGAFTMPDNTIVTSKIQDGQITAAKLAGSIYGGSGAATTLARSDHAHGAIANSGFSKFRVRRNSGSTVADGGYVPFNVADDFDDLSMHDPAGANPERINYVAAAAGKWLLICEINFNYTTASSQRWIIVENGVTFEAIGTLLPFSASATALLTCSGVVSLAAGQYFDVRVYNGTSAAKDVYGTLTGIYLGT